MTSDKRLWWCIVSCNSLFLALNKLSKGQNAQCRIPENLFIPHVFVGILRRLSQRWRRVTGVLKQVAVFENARVTKDH